MSSLLLFCAMLKKAFFCIFFFAAALNTSAQNAHSVDTGNRSSHLRITLLTCGMGTSEVWEVFGHTGLRVIDSVHHTDWVYNYGTFEFGDDFELKFARGKLLYNLSVWQMDEFMQEYVDAHRMVEEQDLLLTDEQKEAIRDFLNNNALPANKYYKYDFFLDNCATRIRDIFPKILGSGFKFKTVSPQPPISFRTIINQYFYYRHWERVGVNILLGSRIDHKMTNDQIMFLPDFLRDGLAGASLNGHPISTTPVKLLQGSEHRPAPLDQPLLVSLALLLLTGLGLFIKPLRILGTIMSAALMLVTGLLGCIILVMWFGTDHQACSDNFNLFWALPTNLLLVFRKPRGTGRYAIIAACLILATLILHITAVQQTTLPEMIPLFIALLLVYYNMYKKRVPQHATA